MFALACFGAFSGPAKALWVWVLSACMLFFRFRRFWDWGLGFRVEGHKKKECKDIPGTF